MSKFEEGNNVSKDGSVCLPKVSRIQRILSWLRNRIIPQISLTPAKSKGGFRPIGFLTKCLFMTTLLYLTICFIQWDMAIYVFDTIENRILVVAWVIMMMVVGYGWEKNHDI